MCRNPATFRFFLFFSIFILALGGALQAEERWPSSELLVPCFEVRLDVLPDEPLDLTTYFAVVSSGEDVVPVRVSVLSNWGIEVLETQFLLAPNQVASFDLGRWLTNGTLPDRQLSAAELQHVQEALCGEASSLDGLYYSTLEDLADPDRAVGSIVIQALPMKANADAPDVLWGDFFIRDTLGDFGEAEVLANLDPVVTPRSFDDDDLCDIHGFRFFEYPALDLATGFMVWNANRGTPGESPLVPNVEVIPSVIHFYDESGAHLAAMEKGLLPLEWIRVAELDPPADFGWIKIDTLDVDAFVTVSYQESNFSRAAMEAFCLERQRGTFPGPAIQIEKLVNSVDADLPPGPTFRVGAQLEWRYVVTNIGQEPLTNIEVTDIDPDLVITCPGDTLEPGESMTCTAEGEAQPCQRRNVGYVIGITPAGETVSDWDACHYVGARDAAIELEKHTNRMDADEPTGPDLEVGAPVFWTYRVTNSGDVPLTEVQVVDSELGPIDCPQSSLEPGETMVCTAEGIATAGQYENLGRVSARTPCDALIQDDDPSHYYGRTPGIRLEKLTNGEDADEPNGPSMPVGAPIVWTYEVTNEGDTELYDVEVVDDMLGVIDCPKSTLEPGETMICLARGTCAANGELAAGLYKNIAEVTAVTDDGTTVNAADPSHCFCLEPGISIEKLTNGEDADQPPGPTMEVGELVTWSYVVTNTGNVDLIEVQVMDDQEGMIHCPETSLAAGQSMICRAEGVMGEGQYANLGRAGGRTAEGRTVEDKDPSHCYGLRVHVDLEKHTEGVDADLPPGPSMLTGAPVTWTFHVTNDGEVDLYGIQVVDDVEGLITCPKDFLTVGESMMCTATGTMISGFYENWGEVTATSAVGTLVGDIDPSHCTGECGEASIDLEKHTNGHDADIRADAPRVSVGEPIFWEFIVTNTGNVPLWDVTVMDDKIGLVCTIEVLAAGESQTCSVHGFAKKCTYHRNVGSVTANAPCDVVVRDSDPSHYGVDPGRYEGCTPGYWKNHHGSWPDAGLSPTQALVSVFSNASLYTSTATATLDDALHFGGGPGVEGAAEILGRAAVAAYLNASHPGVGYPATPAEVQAAVEGALASGDRDFMLSVAAGLDQANNYGCPLSGPK